MGHDADDFGVRIVFAITREVLAKRLLIGKLLAGERFVDYRHPRAALRVLRGEEPAFDEADAHRLQIVGTRDVQHRLRLFAWFGHRTSDDGERSVGCLSERYPVRERRRLDAGQSRDAPIQIVKEVEYFAAFILLCIERELHRQQIQRLEPGVRVEDAYETLDLQPRAD